MINKIAVLGLFILSVTIAAAVGGFVMPGDWYNKELIQPSWTPPNAVFGPVWTILYIMIAIAGFRVWLADGWQKRAHGMYAVQIILNAAWTLVFFGLHATSAALGIIFALLVAIIATAVLFAKHDRLAAMLLIPYLLWVGYATSLNVGIVALN